LLGPFFQVFQIAGDVGAAVGIPVVVASEGVLQIFDALGARERADPFLLNVGIVGIKFVGAVDHILGALVHGERIAHASQTKEGAGLGISGVGHLDPFFFGFEDLALAKPYFAAGDADAGMVGLSKS